MYSRIEGVGKISLQLAKATMKKAQMVGYFL